MRELISLVVAVLWAAGVVLAKGFWATLAATVLPPFGLYLVVERAMQVAGIVP